MPELPEVETTRAGVAPYVTGQRVEAVVVRQPQLRWPVSPALSKDLPGQHIRAVTRRAKYLLFEADRGHVCLHLGMSGRLRVVPADTPLQRHDHVDLIFGNNQILRFNDSRRFGSIFWLTDDPGQFKLLAGLGPEPLGNDFTADWLHARAQGRRVAVKNFIMDSHVVVGVGNIYANEALFMAGIHPHRPAGRISHKRYARLVTAIRDVLTDAIRAGGTTLRDYVSVDGHTGWFQQTLSVYDRAGTACPRDGTPIRRSVVGQRSTFYCPRCQR